jgi:hypothetical protein
VWVSRESWEVAESLLPVHRPDPRDGRVRADGRVCLNAIVLVVLMTVVVRRGLRRVSWVARRRRRTAASPRGARASAPRVAHRVNPAGPIDWSTEEVDRSHMFVHFKGPPTPRRLTVPDRLEAPSEARSPADELLTVASVVVESSLLP